MADIISREKAIETIQYRVCQGHGNKEHICKRGSCAYCGIMEIINDIENIEAADVQSVDAKEILRHLDSMMICIGNAYDTSHYLLESDMIFIERQEKCIKELLSDSQKNLFYCFKE